MSPLGPGRDGNGDADLGQALPPLRLSCVAVLCALSLLLGGSYNHENGGYIHRFLRHQVSVGLSIVSGFIFILSSMGLGGFPASLTMSGR